MRAIFIIVFSGILGPALQSQSGPPATPAEPDASRTVLVVLTTHGMSLSHSVVKPGKVRFLLANHTPLNAPALEITSAPTGGGSGIAAAVQQPANSESHNRRPYDATLSPGNYTISIRGVPGIAGQIRVQP